MKVSIVIPVYNVEKYIRQCLESVINQTLKDIEIIIVNDGTKESHVHDISQSELMDMFKTIEFILGGSL